MKNLICCLVALTAGALPLCRPAFAQAMTQTTNPFSILTDTDIVGSCSPQFEDSGLSHYVGCCGSPGRRGCFLIPFEPACLQPTGLSTDSYSSSVLCMLPAIGVDPIIPKLGQSGPGADMTFYVTSDIHFYRTTFSLSDQLTHVKVMSSYASSGAMWPTGVGIPANTPIATPLAVIFDGDLTTESQAPQLGAFRMMWEHGTIPDSIQYPVLFGLGNHDINTNVNSESDAQRMFDYLTTRMANTNMDPNSGNYSWDWNGVHMIQLNTWAGDLQSKFVHYQVLNGQDQPPDGLSWLQQDLQTHVGNSTKPVMIFQHYGLYNVPPPVGIADTANSDWHTDATAKDAQGNLTGKGYESFFNIVKNYNVIGMFTGHDHCLGTSSTTNMKPGGNTFPNVFLYGQPIEDFDDGSGGDTGGTGNAQNSGLGNECGQQLLLAFLPFTSISTISTLRRSPGAMAPVTRPIRPISTERT